MRSVVKMYEADMVDDTVEQNKEEDKNDDYIDSFYRSGDEEEE